MTMKEKTIALEWRGGEVYAEGFRVADVLNAEFKVNDGGIVTMTVTVIPLLHSTSLAGVAKMLVADVGAKTLEDCKFKFEAKPCEGFGSAALPLPSPANVYSVYAPSDESFLLRDIQNPVVRQVIVHHGPHRLESTAADPMEVTRMMCGGSRRKR